MHWWQAIFLRRSQFEAEIDEELRFHIERQTEENVRQGMSPDEARREALRVFGGVEQTREGVRDTARIAWLSDFWQDVRFAGRLIARSPGFALTVIGVLGLTIGVCTTIFSFVQAILIQPLPLPDSDRLVIIRTVNSAQDLQWTGASGHDFLDWRDEATSFEGMAAFHWTIMDLTDGQSSERVKGMFITRDFFDVLRIPPALGRTFSIEEENEKKRRVLILGHNVWVKRYEGDAEIVGKTVDVYSWSTLPEIGANAWQVVGVVGRDVPFLPTVAGPEARQLRIDELVQFWRPLTIDDEYHRGWRDLLTVVARLKPGVTLEEANAEMKAISRQLAEEYPDSNRGWTAEVVGLHAMVTKEIRPALLLLSGAVGFLLLIACANVASLMLVRGIARQQEMAVRIAVGAGRFRLVRQLVTESVLLCVLSGAAGVLLATWSIELIRSMAPSDVPRLREVALDVPVLSFAVGLSLLTGIGVGVVPSLLASQTDVNESLKFGGRGASSARSRRRLMSLLVATETAVCLVLLTGAALLIRSFISITGIDPGFRT
ncbi:MAG: ABC transporter permease, partial [Gammaproteobacteria bacterium]